ncbi:MAG: sterol desaturase family protein, partial [Acidimicrobiales bacterium]|nr:sterol desaturase family protein [Acidimicrobiales bacterium]
MGVGSILAPLTITKLANQFTPGKGRYAKALIIGTVGAAVVATVADRVVAKERSEAIRGCAETQPTNPPTNRAPSRRVQRSLAKRIASSAGVVAVSGAVLAASTAWASRTAANRLFDSHQRDLGDGPLATLGAVLGWDFIYYWNHRLMHETRWLWAIHVVHHSSEHYNLSTALRQPVLDVFGMFVPYGLLSLAGFRPESIETARGVNLLYQYWIHTET